MGDTKKKDQLEETVDAETLEKSWNDALGNLKGLLDKPLMSKALKDDHLDSKGVHAESRLSKNKTRKAKKNADFEEEEEEEEDEEEVKYSKGKKMSKSEEEEELEEFEKSLEEDISELDEEAEIAMDVEPFLKSFVGAVDGRLQKLGQKISKVEQLQKAQGDVLVASAEMQKSTQEAAKKVSEQAAPVRSVLSKASQRFGSGEGEVEMNRMQILQKSHELVKEGKLDLLTATKIENRLNKGQDLTDEMKQFFTVGGK